MLWLITATNDDGSYRQFAQNIPIDWSMVVDPPGMARRAAYLAGVTDPNCDHHPTNRYSPEYTAKPL